MKNLLMVAIFAIIFNPFVNAQTLDTSYPTVVTEKTEPVGAYLLSDGKYFLYGSFTRNNGVTRPGLIKFNADGSTDNTFDIGSGPNGPVEAVAVQSDGKILVAGRFTTFNNVARKIFIRLHPDGTIDNTFNPNITVNNTGMELNLLIQPDGKILFNGPVQSVDGFSTGSTLFRYNANGSVDATFSGPSYAYQARGIGRQTDGKIILVGTFAKGIVRLTDAGAADATFDVGSGFDGFTNTVIVNSSNQIFVGGYFTTYKGSAANYLVCLTTSGAVDATWQGNSKPIAIVNDAHLLPDGKLLIAGGFATFNSISSKGLARLNTNGTLDGTLVVGSGANGEVKSIHANATGEIIITGSSTSFNSYNGTSRPGGVAVIQANGSIKAMTVHPNFQRAAWVRSIMEQGTDKFLIGHMGTEVNATAAANFARLNQDGTLDGTFSGNGKPNSYVDAITIDRNGKILIGGAFTTYNGTNTPRMARLSSLGVLETTFNTNLGTGFNSNVNVIVEQSDGKILVGGGFATFNGAAKKALVRLNEDGTIDATFNTANGFSSSTGTTQLFDIEIQSDGKILVAGEFTAFGANSVKNLIRLNADGTYDNSFNVGSGIYHSYSSSVNALTILSNGKILAGGHVVNGGTGTNNIDFLVLLSSTGAIENGYKSNNFFIVEALKKQSDGKILVVDRNAGVRRLNADGTIDNTFITINLESWERGVAILGNSLIAVGGLGLAEGKMVMGVAKYDLPAAVPVAPATLGTSAIAQTTVGLSWTDTGTESGFYLERSIGNNTSFAVIATLPANTTTFTNTGLTANSQYYYRVRAFNAKGLSPYTSELSVTTLNTVPAAPTNFKLAVVSSNEIRLDWTDASNNESGFEIYRSSPSNTSYALLATTGANAVYYTDPTVTPGAVYFYKIRSINNGGVSSYTTELSGVAQTPVPITPTNLLANAANESSIVLTWTDNAFNEAEYVIERAPGGSSVYTQLAVVPANTTEYIDASVTFGQSYNYRLRARNEVGFSGAADRTGFAGYFMMGNRSITTCQGLIFDSGFGGDYSNNESYTLKIFPPTPGTALRLVFESFSVATSDQLKIHNGDSDFEPLIGAYSGTTLPPTIISTSASGALTLVFTSNASGTSSGWRINLSCGVFPANPTNVVLTVPNMAGVKLDWADNATDETGYAIERYVPTLNNDFTPLIVVGPNTTTYTDNSITANTTAYYRVKAKGAQNDSEYTSMQGIAFGDGGIWRTRKDFDGTARTDAVAFSVAGKGYIGTGWAGGAQTANFRSYDQANDTWSTAVAGFGGSVRSEAAAFVIGNKAYVGLGEWLDPAKDLHEYDPAANIWTKKADFGGAARTGAIGFTIGNNGYFGLGYDGTGYTKDFWRYDAAGNSWTQVADLPGDARYGAVVFVIGDYAYAGSGYNGSTRLKDFYKYDPAANTWTAIAAFPGVARRNAVAFAADGKGYVGTGDSGSDRKDFYRYDPATDTWMQIVNFAGSARAYAVAFGLNGKGYVSTGFDGVNKRDMWEFTPANILAAPAAPTTFVVVTQSISQINLSWVDNTADETAFVLERAKSSTGFYEVIATIPANTTSYADLNLDAGSWYYYRVKAITPSGSSAYATGGSTTAPSAPTGLTATLANDLLVELAWNLNTTGTTGYVVERAVNANSGYFTLAVLGSSAKTYNDITTEYGTTYYYRVRATNSGGVSSPSNEVSVTTVSAPINAPTSLTAEALSASTIRLRWIDNSDNETSFRISRAASEGGPFLVINTLGANTTEYMDPNLLAGTTYYYRVQARTTTFNSTQTSVASATTLKTIPAAPANLTAIYDATLDNISLQWTDGSNNEEEFVIQKALTPGVFSDFATTTGTSYTDENPGTNFRVLYRVAAKNSAGLSGFSNTATIIITSLEGGYGITGLKTFPNPAADRVMIEWTSEDRGEVKLSITDVTGRELSSATFQKNAAEFKEEVSLKNIAGNSLVLMRVAIGQKSIIRKIAVK